MRVSRPRVIYASSRGKLHRNPVTRHARCLRFEQLQLWNDWASRLPLTQLAALFSRCSCFTDCFVWNGTLLSTVSRISESVNPFRADRFLCHTANWVNSDQYEILYY